MNRTRSLDICRAVCCLTVVFGHTMMYFWDFDPSYPTWIIYNYVSTFARHTLSLFFMISGALLLSRKTLNLKKHLGRIGHFLLLYFVWGFIFACIDNRFWHVWYSEASLTQLLFSSYYHLWYLAATTLCYAFLPLLHSAIHKTGLNMKYCFGLILLTAVAVNTAYLPNKPLWLELLLQNFDFAYIKYLVYFFLGWWLYENKLSNKQLTILGVLAFAAVGIYAWLNRRYSISIGAASNLFYDFLSPAMLLMSCFAFCLYMKLKSVPKCFSGILDEFLMCSFGIYIIHPPLVSFIKNYGHIISQYSTAITFPLIFVFFLSFSFIATMILRRIPLIKKLVT